MFYRQRGIVVSLGLFVSFTLAAGEGGSVTLTRTSAAAYDAADGGAWSDGEAPHAGADYFVPVGKSLDIPNANMGTFGGDSLTIAGGVSWGGGWGKTFTPAKPITVLEGVTWTFSSYHHTFTVRPLIVRSTAAKPFTFSFGNRDANDDVDHYYPSTFQSDAAAVLQFRAGGPTMVNATKLHLAGADFTDFSGRVKFIHGVNPDIGSISLPGTMEVGTNVVFKLTDAAGASTLGGLCLRTGSTFSLAAANAHLVRIGGRLEIEPGARVLPNKFADWSAGRHDYPVFELTAAAVAASGDLEAMMAGVAVPDDGVKRTNGWHPTLRWTVLDNDASAGEAAGGKKICLGYELVTQSGNYGWGNDAFRLDRGEAASTRWSDGRYPHADADYLCSGGGQTLGYYSDGPARYVFPGRRLAVIKNNFGLYKNIGDFTADFVLSGAKFRAMEDYTTYHLRGTIEMLGYSFLFSQKNTVCLDADIFGSGDLTFGMDYENAAAVTKTTGWAELNGDNSRFTGKISVSCWQTDTIPAAYAAVFPAGRPFAAGPTSNLTLSVSSAANLGGPLDAFAYDALKIGNECRLTIRETATFATAGRGWHFPGTAYVNVADGRTATVRATVTLGAGGRLVKEGGGMLALERLVVEAGGTQPAALEVASGGLAFGGGTAVAGLSLSLAAGTRLAVKAGAGDAAFRVRGIDLSRTAFAFPEGVGTLPLEIDLSGADPTASVVEVAALTVPTDRLAACREALAIAPVDGFRMRILTRDNADDSKTLVVRLKRVPPLSLVVKGASPPTGCRVSERWGYDPVDATAIVQAALDSGEPRIILDRAPGPWYVRPLQLRSDQEIVFEDGAELCAKRGEFKNRYIPMLTMADCRNVTLRGRGTIRMWKTDYADPTQYDPAEWRHALVIRTSENVLIEDLTLAESGGDGIYVSTEGAPSRNVTLRRIKCLRNHRQGMSVLAVDGLKVEDSVFADTSGTPPEAGVDFEPNDDGGVLRNCVFRRCAFTGNNGFAIDMLIDRMGVPSGDLSIAFEDCFVSSVSNKLVRGAYPDGGVFRSPNGDVSFVNLRVRDTNGVDTVYDFAYRVGTPAGVTCPPVVDDFDFGAATVTDEAPGEIVPLEVAHMTGNRATAVFYAAAAGDVELYFRQVPGWLQDVQESTMTLSDLSGNVVGTFPYPGKEETRLPLAVPAAGFYVLTADTRHSSICFTRAAVPIALDRRGLPRTGASSAGGWGLKTIGSLAVGRLYVPVGGASGAVAFGFAGTASTCRQIVPLSGEAVYAKLIDPNGAAFWARDNITEPIAVFVGDAPKAGLWCIEFKNPGNNRFDDFMFDVAGVPAFFFLSNRKYWSCPSD